MSKSGWIKIMLTGKRKFLFNLRLLCSWLRELQRSRSFNLCFDGLPFWTSVLNLVGPAELLERDQPNLNALNGA
jgi:hypothetical protein